MRVPGTRRWKASGLEAGGLWGGGVVSQRVPTWGGRAAPALHDVAAPAAGATLGGRRVAWHGTWVVSTRAPPSRGPSMATDA